MNTLIHRQCKYAATQKTCTYAYSHIQASNNTRNMPSPHLLVHLLVHINSSNCSFDREIIATVITNVRMVILRQLMGTGATATSITLSLIFSFTVFEAEFLFPPYTLPPLPFALSLILPSPLVCHLVSSSIIPASVLRLALVLASKAVVVVMHVSHALPNPT